MKFILKLILRIICAPIVAILAITVWLCKAILCCSSFIFSILSTLGVILALLVFFTSSKAGGIVLLVLAALVSPMGLPLLAVHFLAWLQKLRYAIQDAVYT